MSLEFSFVSYSCPHVYFLRCHGASYISERSWTVGDDTADDKFGYLAWWLGADPIAPTTYGFGGQRVSVNTKTSRVLAILSDNYYKEIGLDTYEDPTAKFPTDQIVEKFMFTNEVSSPNACDEVEMVAKPNGDGPSVTPAGAGDPSNSHHAEAYKHLSFLVLSLTACFLV